MGETTVWDQIVAGESTETLFEELLWGDFPNQSMERFLIQHIPTKDGADWSEQLARELDVSSTTVRNRVRVPAEKHRESYLAIAVFLKLDAESTDLFLTKLAKTTRLYSRNMTDAPYFRLIHNRARFEMECPRQDGEPIPRWIRRAMPESFLEDSSAKLHEWLQPFFKRKGWKLTQLANDTGIEEDVFRKRERRCFAGSRETALAVAVSLEMTEEEINHFLSMCMCEGPSRLDSSNSLDALYLELLRSRISPKGDRKLPKRHRAEPILTWARRADCSIFGGEEAQPGNTTFFDDALDRCSMKEVRELIRSTPDSRTHCRKALQIFMDWIGDTEQDKSQGNSSWLAKNAGNRRWKAGGYQSQEVKKEWDKLRRALESDGKSVSRDDLIQLGMLLRMDLEKMNEVLSVCDHRKIHSNNGHIFETYLFCAWKEFSNYFYGNKKMPTECLSIDVDSPIPDLQWYFSGKVDQSFKPMREYLQTTEEQRKELQKKGKQPAPLAPRLRQYQQQQKNPPGWYLSAEERDKRFYRLRTEAIKQALWEYPRIQQEERRKIKDRLADIKKNGQGYVLQQEETPDQLEDFVRNRLEAEGGIFGLTLEGSINCSLDAWGFSELGADCMQNAADAQLVERLGQLSAEPDKKQLETLHSLVCQLYENH